MTIRIITPGRNFLRWDRTFMADEIEYRKDDEIIDDLIKNSHSKGNFSYSSLIEYITKFQFWGVAKSSKRDRKYYVLFCGGEPEGALVSDRKGTLVGDRAVLALREPDNYELYPVDPTLVDQLVLGCRIFDKSHAKKDISMDIPELGKKSDGVGRFTMIVRKDGIAQPGLKIMIRKAGQVVGSDFTNREGKAMFKLKTGKYEIVLTQRDGQISLYEVLFDSASPRGPSILDL